MKVETVIVDGSMSWLNMALIVVPTETFTVPSAGIVETIAGGVALAVVNVHE